MYEGRGKLHGSRLVAIGAAMALIGLSLSVTIVMLKFPRHREICSVWSPPGTFRPHSVAPLAVNGVRPLHESELADVDYHDFLDVMHRGSLGFLPTLPKNTTNVFAESEIDKWKAQNRCVKPVIVDASQNDPTQQRVMMRVTTAGTLVTFCCQATTLELYFPPTISESIRDWSAPEGRIFFGFIIIASVLVLMSFHPYTLSNVCTANDTVFGCVNTALLRHFFPPIGLMLVACVPTVPVDVMYLLSPTWTEIITNLIMFSVHMVGAIGAFAGYAVAEVWALNILPDCIDSLEGELEDVSDIIFHKQLLHGKQRPLRVLCVCIILLGCGLFSVGFTIVMFAGAQKVVHVSEGALLFFRVVTYFSEAATAMGLGLSLLTIWWYCPERHVVIPIKRDLSVLERHMSYLHQTGLSRVPLADLLAIKDEKLRKHIDTLEEEVAFRFRALEEARALGDDGALNYRSHATAETIQRMKDKRQFKKEQAHGRALPLEIDVENATQPLLA